MERQVLPADSRITIYGNRKDITKATEVLSKYEDRSPKQLTEEWKKHDPRLEDVEDFIKFLNAPILSTLSEPDARLMIQNLIDREKLKASILFDGNTVWSFNRIIRNLKQIVKAGKLYSDGTPGEVRIGMMIFPSEVKPILSKYLYNFFHLKCGSIAHYNIHGWISHYPTLEDLRRFFIQNEHGKRVLDHIPPRFTDAKKIVREIEQILEISEDDPNVKGS